ncbi:hypothetical protein YC2023_061080 [Brassica napus]
MKKEELIEEPKSERGLVFDEKVDDMSVDAMKQHVDWRKECHRQLPNEPRVRDNGTFPAVCVCLPHIEQKYCWFSTDCGHVSNLVFRISCQQYKDMCSLFFPHKIIMWERDLMLSTVTLLWMSQSTSLRNLSSTHRICSIACVGQKFSDILENTSNECKFCNDRRLIFHGIIFHVGVLVEWFEVEYEAVREFLCVVTFGMEESGIMCTPLALKPFMLLPYMFTAVPSEFVLATRILSIITLGSSDDMTNISIAEVSQFVQPMWLTRISSFSPLFLRPLRYCVLQPFLYNLSLLVVLARQEPEFYDIHIGSLYVSSQG